MSTNPSPVPQPVYATGPRNGSSYAALTLGILAVCLVFIPIVSSIMAIIAIILGANGRAASWVGTATARVPATWGIALGIVNLAIWGAIILIVQLGANFTP